MRTMSSGVLGNTAAEISPPRQTTKVPRQLHRFPTRPEQLARATDTYFPATQLRLPSRFSPTLNKTCLNHCQFRDGRDRSPTRSPVLGGRTCFPCQPESPIPSHQIQCEGLGSPQGPAQGALGSRRQNPFTGHGDYEEGELSCRVRPIRLCLWCTVLTEIQHQCI